MSEERIWAPWRLAYISGQTPAESEPAEPPVWMGGADDACFLCRAAANYDDQPAADRSNLVVQRTEHVTVLLNRFPYNNGHLLVSPRRHVAELPTLSTEESLDSIRLLTKYVELLGELIRADGFNIGLNLGAAAGAGLPGHLHWHLVPRWSGDNNFMPTLAGTRVISQSLESLWEALADAVS